MILSVMWLFAREENIDARSRLDYMPQAGRHYRTAVTTYLRHQVREEKHRK